MQDTETGTSEATPGAPTDAISTPAPAAEPVRARRRRVTRPAGSAEPAAGEPAAPDGAPATEAGKATEPSAAPDGDDTPAPAKRSRRRVTKAAGPAATEPVTTEPVTTAPAAANAEAAADGEPARPATRTRRTRRVANAEAATSADAPTTETARTEAAPATGSGVDGGAPASTSGQAEPAAPAPARKVARRRKAAAAAEAPPADVVAPARSADGVSPGGESPAALPVSTPFGPGVGAQAAAPTMVPPPVVTFMAPDAAASAATPTRRRTAKKTADQAAGDADQTAPVVEESAADAMADTEVAEDADGDEDTGGRRRRRGRRGRGKSRADGDGQNGDGTDADDAADETEEPGAEGVDEGEDDADDGTSPASRRRRRRRRRGGSGDDAAVDDPPNTVVHVREARSAGDEVQSVKGSTRLEAKRQRRREGRETQRRRPPILSEAEFLARREAVERQMVVRQTGDRTQIAVLEDGVLVEHYVTKSGSTSYAGNVYLGKVQNVLPSMEAAFIDIGKGRNAVLYAGEVNWDVSGLEGKARSIEQALRSGDSVLVQVTKDPIGHKGARLTSQISLPGRYLVYVPNGSMTGISRKLPDTERQRLKDILKKIVPDDAGVIIRTAAEGASEDELARDVSRLQAQWKVIQEKAAKGGAPVLLSEEPDLAIRVVRDVFNEDFASITVSGGEVAETLEQYISHVAPDLLQRLHKHTAEGDVFHDLRIDEQLMKALDRKVWLPSGGSLVIDRTEAMTVVDVNTGKFTGRGGNLEETVTRNNLEAAEEIVRQLRLRDIGGIIVIDFIDMVLESNRDLVMRRLMECLGRDRTKHQVAEVTSLGLVQMTRKRVGQGLLEAFSEPCEVCKGRGIIVHAEPVDESRRRPSGATKKAEPPVKTESARTVEQPAKVEDAGTDDKPARTRSRRRRGGTDGQVADGGDTTVTAPGGDAAEVAEPEEVAVAAAAVAGLPSDSMDDAPGAVDEVLDEAVADATEPDSGMPRRRRRRAASRPAGPPVTAASG
jgi:ribonuclease E